MWNKQQIAFIAVTGVGIVSALYGDSKPVVLLSFRDSVTVRDAMIYVSDIASVSSELPEIAGRVSATPAGASAPPGFSRFVGPDELLMFRLKPAFKDVEFKTNTNKRLFVKTVCIEKRVGEFSDLIRDYLRRRGEWNDTQWSFTLLNPETTWKCYDAPLDVSVEEIRDRNLKGEIHLQLVAEQGDKTLRIPVACRISVRLPICVAKREINRGKIIDSNDLELKLYDCSSFGFTPIAAISDAVGKKAARSIRAGTVVHDRMLRTLPIVSKGDALTIVMEKGRVRIHVAAIARENGNAGQKIWVENVATHRLIRASVKDKYTVELL